MQAPLKAVHADTTPKPKKNGKKTCPRALDLPLDPGSANGMSHNGLHANGNGNGYGNGHSNGHSSYGNGYTTTTGKPPCQVRACLTMPSLPALMPFIETMACTPLLHLRLRCQCAACPQARSMRLVMHMILPHMRLYTMLNTPLTRTSSRRPGVL